MFWLLVMVFLLIIDEVEFIILLFELFLLFFNEVYWIFSVFKFCCYRGIFVGYINDDDS